MRRRHLSSVYSGFILFILLISLAVPVGAEGEAPPQVISTIGPVQSTPPVTSSVVVDPFEIDDTPEAAHPIEVNGEGQLHLFGVPGDVDWVRFSAERGKRYLIATEELLGESDPMLFLYTADEQPMLLAWNDDFAGTPAARLIWEAPETGEYLIQIVEEQDRFGLGIGYRLIVRTGEEADPLPLAKGEHPRPPRIRPFALDEVSER